MHLIAIAIGALIVTVAAVAVALAAGLRRRPPTVLRIVGGRSTRCTP